LCHDNAYAVRADAAVQCSVAPAPLGRCSEQHDTDRRKGAAMTPLAGAAPGNGAEWEAAPKQSFIRQRLDALLARQNAQGAGGP